MELYPETRPELFDQYGEPLWHDDETLIAGECFDDSTPALIAEYGRVTRFIYVNLVSRPDGLFAVRVYDCDDGGPVDYWVDELFDNEAEARDQYNGRVVEAHDNTPGYVRNIYGPNED